VAERTIIEFEKLRHIDAELLAVLAFKFQWDLPLTTGEYSALLGEDPATATRKRVSGADAPPFVRFGRKVRYLPSAVRAWMAERPLHRSTSEQPANAA
jgi:hypothetical protein